MYGYVYETTNIINGKKYIGQHTADVFEPNKYIGSGKILVEAIKKYGKENFNCILLRECSSKEELDEWEKYYIKIQNAVDSPDYYNIAKGGEGHTCEPWNKGKHGVQEWTPNMEKAFEKGRHMPASPKLKAILSEYRKNVVVSDNTKAKLSEKQSQNRTINNGVVRKVVKIYELDDYLNAGWHRGRGKNTVLEGSTTKG